MHPFGHVQSLICCHALTTLNTILDQKRIEGKSKHSTEFQEKLHIEMMTNIPKSRLRLASSKDKDQQSITLHPVCLFMYLLRWTPRTQCFSFSASADRSFDKRSLPWWEVYCGKWLPLASVLSALATCPLAPWHPGIMILVEGGGDRTSMGRFVQFNPFWPCPALQSVRQTLSSRAKQLHRDRNREGRRKKQRLKKRYKRWQEQAEK